MFPNQFYSPSKATIPAIKKSINWGSLLNNTQKTLNIVNQAIPIVYQIKPIVNNARTMLKVANEFSKTNKTSNTSDIPKSNTTTKDNNGPNFFI